MCNYHQFKIHQYPTGKATLHGALVWQQFKHAITLNTIVRQNNEEQELKNVLMAYIEKHELSIPFLNLATSCKSSFQILLKAPSPLEDTTIGIESTRWVVKQLLTLLSFSLVCLSIWSLFQFDHRGTIVEDFSGFIFLHSFHV